MQENKFSDIVTNLGKWCILLLHCDWPQLQVNLQLIGPDEDLVFDACWHVSERVDDDVSSLWSRLRKVWQKRKCSVKNGFLTISHGTVQSSSPIGPRAWVAPPSCLHVHDFRQSPKSLLLGLNLKEEEKKHLDEVHLFFILHFYFFVFWSVLKKSQTAIQDRTRSRGREKGGEGRAWGKGWQTEGWDEWIQTRFMTLCSDTQ